MSLSRYRVGAGLAISDMDRAREFYEGKLGLSVSIDSGDNVQYRCAEGTVMHDNLYKISYMEGLTRVRVLRRERGLTQQELGRKSGLANTTFDTLIGEASTES